MVGEGGREGGGCTLSSGQDSFTDRNLSICGENRRNVDTRGKASEAEGTADAKALGWKCTRVLEQW